MFFSCNAGQVPAARWEQLHKVPFASLTVRFKKKKSICKEHVKEHKKICEYAGLPSAPLKFAALWAAVFEKQMDN